MSRQIFAAEINFEDTPLNVREKFNDSEKNVRRLLACFRERVEEVYIFSTRSRFTVYIAHDDLSPLTEFFHTENNLKGYVQYYYNSEESVTHLMASASGLLSPIKGDGKVLTDLIRCYQWAASSRSLGITLDHALRKAIETARAVRTKTGIDKFCASVVETGIELLYDRLQDLHNKNFLIVGTSKMARLALQYLTREGFRNIALTGHDTVAARQLAEKYSVEFFTIDLVSQYFLRAAIVIGVAHEDLRVDVTPQRKAGAGTEEDKTRFILDLGIPPNFDAHAVDTYAAEFYNLDDLRRLQTSPLESFGGLEAAWRMVMKASNDYVHVLHLLNHSPVLTAYLSRQFTLGKKTDLKDKPKKSFRSIFFFRKAESVVGPAADTYVNAKAHANNLMAENGLEIVRNVADLKKFRFYFSEN